VTYAEFSDRVPITLYRSLGTCLGLVGLLLAALVVMRRVRRKAVVLAASFWGVAMMMAALWVLRVPLNFLTCIFASVLVGLTGDNIIQYLFAGPHGRLAAGIRARGAASIHVSLLMALASLVFVGSSFVPSRRLGVLLAAGFLVTLAGDLWVLKALWRGGERAKDVPPGA
jgi:predicted exporter